MNTREIKIVYIDDNPDDDLVSYLRDFYKPKNIQTSVKQIKFGDNYTYETLLNDEIVKESNIIVIDSKLFENYHVSESKFTGEEFQLILRKEYSFIEVVIISQNKQENKKIIEKFSGNRGDDPIKHYQEKITQSLDEAVQNVLYYRDISVRLRGNKSIEKVLAEKIVNSLEGINEYSDLNKDDIDKIIKLFGEIQDKYEKRL